jgi:PIN domain nuclease of toxin-antitoxin system
MRLLLDTQAAIWSVSASGRIAKSVVRLIEEADEIFVSACSIWEIAIKFRLGRVNAPPFSGAAANEKFLETGYRILEMRAEHAIAVETLQLDHGDPFDRIILAQAVTEPLRLVTKDRKLARFSEAVISW